MEIDEDVTVKKCSCSDHHRSVPNDFKVSWDDTFFFFFRFSQSVARNFSLNMIRSKCP